MKFLDKEGLKIVYLRIIDKIKGVDTKVSKNELMIAEINENLKELQLQGYSNTKIVTELPTEEISWNTIYIVSNNGAYVYNGKSTDTKKDIWHQLSILSNATLTLNGLMSKEDKVKLDNFGGAIPINDVEKLF